MGKAGRNESKRVAANFLNSIAVALLVTGCISPLVVGDERVWHAALAIIASAAIHRAAVKLAGDLED